MLKSTIVKILLPNVILIALVTLLLSNTPGENIKLWSPKDKLTWSDFKDTLITNSHRVALTSSGIHLSYKVSDNDCVVLVQSEMNRDKSWVDSTKKSDHVLSHEQYHFNITEYWCRKLKKDITNGHFSVKNFREKIQDMQKDNMEQYKAMQAEYDLETKHSLVKAEQTKWEEKIDELLKKTEEYTDKSVSVTLR